MTVQALSSGIGDSPVSSPLYFNTRKGGEYYITNSSHSVFNSWWSILVLSRNKGRLFSHSLLSLDSYVFLSYSYIASSSFTFSLSLLFYFSPDFYIHIYTCSLISPAPSEAPSGLQVREVTSSSVELQWGPLTDCLNINGHPQGWQVNHADFCIYIPLLLSLHQVFL